MRACFLGQNICSLGFGIATLQAPPLVPDYPADQSQASAAPAVWKHPAWEKTGPPPAVANPPRPVP